ncbi:MAG TPA: ABC transporter ATP-binding protein [Halanaerobiales bacterium]|nr:ABC transporter ATP-binding protein [Halanaerobiales bacterium]
MQKEKILEVNNLRTHFNTKEGVVKAVNGVSFNLHKGEILGIVGESGAGKSVTGFSLLRLIDSPGEIVEGEIKYKDTDLLKMNKKRMNKIRGEKISMIFQDPMASLNPVLTIGRQLMEVLQFHLNYSRKEAKNRAIELLEMVGISSPETRLKHYPNQLSGGMRQRVVIAIALASDPEIIIADEPTTALDVTIQAQIIGLMKNLIKDRQTSLIFITHDLALVSEIADRIMVMYAGDVIEHGRKSKIISNPVHPYTKGLIKSIPMMDRDQKRLEQIKGLMPSPLDLPDGCKFHSRCSRKSHRCRNYNNELIEIEKNHFATCSEARQIKNDLIAGVG